VQLSHAGNWTASAVPEKAEEANGSHVPGRLCSRGWLQPLPGCVRWLGNADFRMSDHAIPGEDAGPFTSSDYHALERWIEVLRPIVEPEEAEEANR